MILTQIWGYSLDEIYNNLTENALYSLALLLILGIIGGKLVYKIGLPKVTGYILTGVLIGPYVLQVLSHETVAIFDEVRQVAIGFIGYTIGLELNWKKISKTGKQVVIITLVQAFGAAVFVAIATMLIVPEHKVTYGLIFGAIATATAPAPIIAVVKNYRTKGPVTSVLLPLVALDDAIGIMFFAIMLSLGTSLLGVSGEAINVVSMLWEPMKEIIISISVGGLVGFVLSKAVIKFNRDDDSILLIIILGAVLLGISLGQALEASEILLPMTIGVVLANSLEEDYEHRLMKTTDLFIAPILLAFFTIAGAELDVSKIPIIGFLGIAYIMTRVAGKVIGSRIGAQLAHAPNTVKKYLGYTLIPQAGVAINMALTVELRFGDLAGYESIGSTIATVVLAATVIYEVFGLVIVKYALGKAGEIGAAQEGWN